MATTNVILPKTKTQTLTFIESNSLNVMGMDRFTFAIPTLISTRGKVQLGTSGMSSTAT